MKIDFKKLVNVDRIVKLILLAKTFILEDIWRIDLAHTSKNQFKIISIIRILILAVRGFISNNCMGKASALTYYTLISIVPIVAMAFGISKGFGFDKILEEELNNQFS